MLNIGMLSPGAGEYYIGEVATSAEDYYSGRGESPGRWVGSLAAELGLYGAVEPEDFRRVLQGKHPITGEYLVTAQGSAARASRRRSESTREGTSSELVDTFRAGAQLGVSARYVRRLLEEGRRYAARRATAADPAGVREPTAYLIGVLESEGRAPATAWRVSRSELERFATTRRQPKVRPGYDLTLRPPKSVSVLWALGDDDRRREIRRAHTEAVDEVVRYYETYAVFVRAGGGARHLVSSAGIVAAAFDHRTSRAGDPLLHTHVVTANMTCTADGDEGEPWRAIASPGLYEHARAAGHLYQAHLRHLLATRLGVAFGPVVNGYADVLGVPENVIGVFSKRRAEIAEVLTESASGSARAAQIATLDTRAKKEYGVDPDLLEQRWRAEAEAVGFDADAVAACFASRSALPVWDAAAVERLFDVLAGRYGLTERSAVFRRSEVIEAVASAAGSRLPAREIEAVADRFVSSERALLVDRNAPAPENVQRRVQRSRTQRTYTTPELARLERQLLAWASPGERRRNGLASDAAEAVLSTRPELSDEQREMVRAAWSRAEFIQPIAGRPGAGKTYATEALVAAHVIVGIPIVGCAVSATAAAEFERAAGFARSTGRPATTVASLLVDLERDGDRLRPGTVITVDEASMIGTRELYRLVAAAERAGGSVLLIGDPDQHGSVDVGGVFRRLCTDREATLITLVENNRQEDHGERLAIDDYREGRIADALARYDQAGKIVRSQTAGESFDAIVADWYAARLDGVSEPMIAGPNSTRRALNERARTILKANDELTGRPVVVAGRELMVGDEVVARRNDRTLRAPGAREWVKNGSTGVVAAVDIEAGEVVVDFDREGRIRIPHSYLSAGHLEHGYARTSYAVQGATYTTARYHPTDVSSFEEGYVALTRARTATHVYVVDGVVPDADDDTTHLPPDDRTVGLAEVADALGRRRSETMAADLSTDLATVAEIARGSNVAALHARRRALERILATAPADATLAVSENRDALDKIDARTRAWTVSRVDAVRALEANEVTTTARERAERTVARADARLAALRRSRSRIEHRLHAAERQMAERHDWLEEHAGAVAEHVLVSRAVQAREVATQVVARSDVPSIVSDALGPEPASQRERIYWRHAVGSVAVYRARYGRVSATTRGVEGILGPRPADAGALADYLDAARAVAAAQDVGSGRAQAELEL